MLFNSYEFLFGFLPVVLTGFFVIAWRSQKAATAWLALASLFFYAWWSPKALPLLLVSIAMNYGFGRRLVPEAQEGPAGARRRKRWLQLALVANLLLLGFFKYCDFFIANANGVLALAGQPPVPLLHVILPIGISFYTFTQIAFLVDCWQGKVRESHWLHYVLFVSYFPHLIAGPVLHHAQMMPQFARAATYRIDWEKAATGITLFTVGLGKKLLIADPISGYADAVFKLVEGGGQPQFFAAWFGALGYACQIYFDFSGYSDMAVGLSLLFGISLPLNFNSPYRALNMIDFWRRWHISLSTFLRDYLYVPLGGNRLGALRRHLNLLVTMLLGGLWHGANWTFVLWGALHGSYLIVNHAWRHVRGTPKGDPGWLAKLVSWALTFACVCIAWVTFRAASIGDAMSIYRGMLNLNGMSLPAGWAAWAPAWATQVQFLGTWHGVDLPGTQSDFFMLLAVALAVALGLPNAAGILATRPQDNRVIRSARWAWLNALAVGLLLGVCLHSMNKVSPFLYFQF